MWTPMDIPIEVSRTGITPIGFKIYDEVSNEPLDISDDAFTCRIGRSLGGEWIGTFSVNVTDATGGEFDIVFNGMTLSPLVSGAQEVANLVYEVKSTSGVTLMRGPLMLIPGIG